MIWDFLPINQEITKWTFVGLTLVLWFDCVLDSSILFCVLTYNIFRSWSNGLDSQFVWPTTFFWKLNLLLPSLKHAYRTSKSLFSKLSKLYQTILNIYLTLVNNTWQPLFWYLFFLLSNSPPTQILKWLSKLFDPFYKCVFGLPERCCLIFSWIFVSFDLVFLYAFNNIKWNFNNSSHC